MDGWGKEFCVCCSALVYSTLLYYTLRYVRYATLSVEWFGGWVGWVCDVFGNFQNGREGGREGVGESVREGRREEGRVEGRVEARKEGWNGGSK